MRELAQGREKRDISTSLSSSSSLSSLSPSLRYYNREIETDLSLHKGASDGNHRMLQQLLSKGYNVNSIDQEGATALMHCVLLSGGVQLACADLLIRKGANIDQQAIDGSTALHSASVVGLVSFIQLLLMNGC
ncbi:PREDICTED: notch-regulated ankyrin repeat-containing protein A-like [Amphimedon queenslandica]|uniref:ANK_REP_REGION domain-containing protein n=1 Tax=Amphimedon queenslandica TaxID=400682 RepID=A0AAN0JG26_AMPQE|nr:PREDICTED: notch-regulated ankyrin repeat-containing protein A-like [Amphimedon queenslandica]|eukprot:XP_019855756.1 PREDICTED: notch-regulated ankyrin repeat-containing protein A-like [Amphimedon queenslandica]